MRRATYRPIAAAALVAALPVLLSVGCQLMLRMSGYSPPWFDHRLHVGEKKLACEDCHPDAATEAAAGMPAPDVCEPCHGDKDKDKPPESRAAAFYPGGQPKWTNFVTLPSDIIFSHAAHAAKGVACAECHPGVAESTRVPVERPMKMEECMACHARRGVSNDCAHCHREIRQDVPPRSHRFDWEEIHGQAVRSDHDSRSRCMLCHGAEDCYHCHQEVAPRNHTNYWRNRGHGALAETDRDRCRTCHQVDFCDRCHSGGEGIAPPKPSWHTPAMNCRQCHFPGHRLPHPDTGADCNRCHR